jgi:hypothetical protein
MGIAEIESKITHCKDQVAGWQKRLLEANKATHEWVYNQRKYYLDYWNRKLGYYHWLYRKKEAEICHTSTS